MNSDNNVFENLAFNLVNLETVILSEIVDPDETYSKNHLLI